MKGKRRFTCRVVAREGRVEAGLREPTQNVHNTAVGVCADLFCNTMVHDALLAVAWYTCFVASPVVLAVLLRDYAYRTRVAFCCAVGVLGSVLPLGISNLSLKCMYSFATVTHTARLFKMAPKVKWGTLYPAWFFVAYVMAYHDLEKPAVQEGKRQRRQSGKVKKQRAVFVSSALQQLLVSGVVTAATVLFLQVWDSDVLGTTVVSEHARWVVFYAVQYGAAAVHFAAALLLLDAGYRLVYTVCPSPRADGSKLLCKCTMNSPHRALTLADFWRRWNVEVQLLVCKPFYSATRRYSRPLAVFAAFLVSGLYHAYPFLLCALAGKLALSSVFSMLLFFVAHAALVLVEDLVGASGKLWLYTCLCVTMPLCLHPVIEIWFV